MIFQTIAPFKPTKSGDVADICGFMFSCCVWIQSTELVGATSRKVHNVPTSLQAVIPTLHGGIAIAEARSDAPLQLTKIAVRQVSPLRSSLKLS